jgi:hypothetical protein
LTEAARARSGCAAAIVAIEAIGRWLLALADDGTVHVSRWTEPVPSAAVVGALRAQLDEALVGRRCRSLGCVSNGEALLLLLEDGEAIVVTLRPGHPLRRIRGLVMDALHTDVGSLLRFEDGEYQWIHALRCDEKRFSCT